MNRRTAGVAALLFTSGFCALVDQTVWLRQFRLIFGASTAATAAVLAVFMAGLGLGGLYLGRRAEGSRNPLAMYGALELGVAISAGLTPLLLIAVRWLYLATGGSFTLGMFFATVVRLLLAVVVLIVPTTLMGGTLPAAARAVETAGDEPRRAVAILYAVNTLGAVAGALLSTFFLLERFGNVRTLIASALLNALVGLAALLISNSMRAGQGGDEIARAEEADSAEEPSMPAVAPRLIYAAAAVTGFVFLLMELVWYRMLAPLLGGTTFTFGLILAVALFGIGSGSFAWSLRGRRRATVAMFALCCAGEALFLAVPLALGDRVAVLALLLRGVGSVGFSGYVFGWVFVTVVVAFVPAFISGIQFPLLISLLGKGRAGVAADVGTAYAWNTAGAIAGSLAGGFGLLPLLTAPGAWRAGVAVAATLSLIAAVLSRNGRATAAAAVGTAIVAVALLFATGPTAFWRHTPIGAGRADQCRAHPNTLRDVESARRRGTVWQAEGVESSVAISDDDGYGFLVNGKGDGHSRLDAGTQVMSGILPALLHPNPQTAVVIGLGTGSTAGWLAALPSVRRVDVVEIEPAIVHVARLCGPVNREAMRNPKVHVAIGDGREYLLTSREKFDVISSEPSNPYRAGIASLFTTAFYRACSTHLAPGGMLVQFLQAYEVDAPTIRTAYATITSVFGHVETWQSKSGDLLLVASNEPLTYDMQAIRARLANPVVREAAWRAWWAADAESILARYVAGDASARSLALAAKLNTDDRTIIEYAFARTLGSSDSFQVPELRAWARSQGDSLPPRIRATADAAAIERRRMAIGVVDNQLEDLTNAPFDAGIRGSLMNAYVALDYERIWNLAPAIRPIETPLELLAIGECVANRGDERAMETIGRLRAIAPVESDALLARLRWREGRTQEAVDALTAAFVAYRTNPWPLPTAMRHAFALAGEMIADPRSQPLMPRLHDLFAEPFAVHMYENDRKALRFAAAERMSTPPLCGGAELAAIASFEPDVPWNADFLRRRAECYGQSQDARAEQARRDLTTFLADAPKRLAPE